MILTDTSFRIRSLVRVTREDAALRPWLQARAQTSSPTVAWAEFPYGPIEATANRADFRRMVRFGLRQPLIGTARGRVAAISKGNNISISLHPSSKAEADRVFNGLAEGGTITMPIADQFWGDYFGSLTDRFGVN